MSMKLLNFTEKKDAQQKEQTLKIIRAQETEEVVKKVNASLAKSQSDFQLMLAKNKEQWALELEEKQKLIDDMDKEVTVLEERKKQALIPISLYKDEADKIIAEAKDILTKAKEREEQAEFLQEKLEEKLTAVSDREQEVTTREQRNEVATKGIQLQQQQTKTAIKELNKRTLEFQVEKDLEESKILQRKKEVSMAEISFNAKVDKYKRDMEALKIWEAQIIDREETFKRTLARKN